MQKASRESKRQTSWNNPNEGYEKDLETFVRGVLGDARLPEAVEALASAVADHGFFNSLSQLVLKFTAPGVPDLYQGSELFDFSLVDPDNRNPVDYRRRQSLVEDLHGLLHQPAEARVRELFEARGEVAKFYLTAQLLRLRRTARELVAQGSYRDVELAGPDADHWLAFVREHDASVLVAIVPRLPATWAERHDAHLLFDEGLAGRQWRDVLTGAVVRPGRKLDLATLPIPWAVLHSTGLAPV
jgi:(1->4)-alpha-D-glucan 1-alpha-D-glucosylmutase